jgi:hypothetical protein
LGGSSARGNAPVLSEHLFIWTSQGGVKAVVVFGPAAKRRSYWTTETALLGKGYVHMIADERSIRTASSIEEQHWFHDGWWILPGAAFGATIWGTILREVVALVA